MPEEFENTVQGENTPAFQPEKSEGDLQVFSGEEKRDEMPEVKELSAGALPLSSEPVKEEPLQVFAQEEDKKESVPEIKELPPAPPAAPFPDELKKMESIPEEEKLPVSFRKEEIPPVPLSDSIGKKEEEESLLLPLEGLEEPSEPKPQKEQAPVLSGSSNTLPGKPASFVRKTVSLPMECGGTLGELLAEARKRTGLTLEEVRELTKIRQENILAMENNKLEELPPAVFVSAYARTLQELYGLDADSRERVTEALDKLLGQDKKEEKALSGEAQEMKNKILKEISSTVKVNLEEERKFRITAFCVLGGLILFLLLVTILILFLIFGGKKESAGELARNVPPFQSENISTLIPAVVPEVQKMELPKNLPSSKPAGKRRR